MPRLTAGDIRELAAVRSDRHLVVSLFIDTDGRRLPRHTDLEEEIRLTLKRGRAQLDTMDVDKDVRTAAQADFDQCERFLAGWERGATRGLAVFRCQAIGLMRVYRLRRPVRSQVRFNHSPLNGPLEEVLAAGYRFAVALADRAHGRVLVVDDGEIVRRADETDPLPRGIDMGHQDRGATKVQQSMEHEVQRHLSRVAGDLAAAVHAENIADVVLGGLEATVAELERLLAADVRRRVVGRVPYGPATADDEVAAACDALDARMEAAREQDLIERLRAAGNGGGKGTVGLGATLDALADRRVATLVVSAGYIAGGWRCPGCGALRAVGPACDRCGTELEWLDDVVEEAIDAAVNEGAAVRMLRDSADVDVMGRIGALLRY